MLNLRADQLKHDVRRGQIDAILGASGPLVSSEQRVLARDVGGERFHRRVGEVVAWWLADRVSSGMRSLRRQSGREVTGELDCSLSATAVEDRCRSVVTAVNTAAMTADYGGP